MRFIPSYSDGQMRIAIEGIALEQFRKTPMWKLKMPAVKSRAEGFEGNEIVIAKDVPLRELELIVASLESCSEWGYVTSVDESFRIFSEANSSKIDERASIGLAIKAKSPKVEREFEEFSSAVDNAMARSLRPQQKWDAFFMCSMRKSANFSVPGSGKTASTLGAFAYLHSRGLADRVVVVSPKNAFGSWRNEWTQCFGSLLPCKSLCFHDQQWTGRPSSTKRRELSLNASRYNLILLNYEATSSYDDILRDIVGEKALLVFDEVHKVKKIGGVRAASALEVARDACYVIALTGTPIPNSYLDIYNLLHILYPDDYDSFFGFRTSMLEKPDQRDVDEINNSLQPFFCRTNKKSLGVPDPETDKIYDVPASSEENDLMSEVKEQYRTDPLALIIRCLQLESDPRMLSEALNPEEFEGIIDGDGTMGTPCLKPPRRPTVTTWPGGLTTKTRECIKLADELAGEGKPLIIWCFFKQSMENIADGLAKRGRKVAIVNGATPVYEREEYLSSFKAGGIDVLITNPHTLAESVSLHSVCHDAIYFEYSYNLVHLLQSKDRIHRLGLPEGQYTQYHFLMSELCSGDSAYSLDRNIYTRLKEKEQVMLDAIDHGILEPGHIDKRDLEAVFEGLFDPPLTIE